MSCISINNQECKVRPEIINVNSDERLFYPFSIKRSKCSDKCWDNINDPYAKMCQELMKPGTENSMERVSVNVD